MNDLLNRCTDNEIDVLKKSEVSVPLTCVRKEWATKFSQYLPKYLYFMYTYS